MRGVRAIAVFLGLWGLFCGAVVAEEIKVPFNFQWGESPQRLEEILTRVQAKIVDRRAVGSRQVLEVEGIPQRMLLRALFYFENDALNEIELHYGNNSWDATQYADFFDQTRRNIDAKYGVGRAVVRQKTRDGDTLETLIGYQWAQPTTSLQIFFFTAERGADALRVVSLHYRGL